MAEHRRRFTVDEKTHAATPDPDRGLVWLIILAVLALVGVVLLWFI